MPGAVAWVSKYAHAGRLAWASTPNLLAKVPALFKMAGTFSPLPGILAHLA